MITRSLVAVSVCLVFALAGATTVAGQSKSSSRGPLEGVWRVAEVTTTGAKASTNKQPQPGLVIFTAKHYSIIRVTADKPRPALA
jgi:hypothetical protein